MPERLYILALPAVVFLAAVFFNVDYVLSRDRSDRSLVLWVAVFLTTVSALVLVLARLFVG